MSNQPLLEDAMTDADQCDDEVDVVLLPPPNVDSDTDTELGNKADLTEMTLETVSEVSGTIEVQASKQTLKAKKVRLSKKKIQKHATDIFKMRRIKFRK